MTDSCCFVLNDAEWTALQAALSHYDALDEHGTPIKWPYWIVRSIFEHLRREIDKAPMHKSEREFTKDELKERAHNNRWPHVAERRKSPETRTIYHWRKIILLDADAGTLEEVLAQYAAHCERQLENGATEPFLAHREGLKGVQTKLDDLDSWTFGDDPEPSPYGSRPQAAAAPADATPRRKLRSTHIPSGMHGLTLDEREWNALEPTLSYCEAHLDEWIPHGPMKDVRLDHDAIERLRAELDKAVKRRSEQEFTKEQLHERTRNNRWPDVGKRPKSPKATIYYWRTLILDDGAWTTLERAMAQYFDHCEWQLANKTRDPFLFIEHRHGIKCIREKLDLSRMDD